MRRFPVTLPLEAIIEGLNRINGRTLMTYASTLAALVAEVRAGRLNISPRLLARLGERGLRLGLDIYAKADDDG